MSARLSPYHRRLFVFLSVATFFEGYDFTALSQILPNLQDAMRVSDPAIGWLGSAINGGTIVAFALVRLADRWGRRRVLNITILGYATFTFLTGLSPSIYAFAAFQFTARVFLVAEWALCMVYAAEEYPAERRGFVLGVIQACNALGAITCAAIVPYLLDTPYAWRAVYFVGVIPLLLLAYARRGLRETDRFLELRAADTRPSLTAIFRTPYGARVLLLALIWGLTYACTNVAVLFWKQFAVNERGFGDDEVGRAVTIATLVALPFVFSAGKLLDWLGRRAGAVVIYGIAALSIYLAYQLYGFWELTACLAGGLFAAIALLTLLNALTTELVPTAMRGDAFAWANNLLGRLGYVLAPGLVGIAAEHVGWGSAVSATVLALVAALALILWKIPETGGKELEETAAL